ncbi:PHP domain-containing protein [Isoalcanivorax beigongshangi]|uniref:PHP domain-containing protein n=1 Tax=Isoalcanivorax beigongshangi TaxID=3238810 RepID=A0ABV4AH85_9GAMM
MTLRYDLHCHSLASDGALSPAALVARAAEQGVQLLALTDHDTLAGLPEARAAAQQHGVTLVPGIELSVDWQGRELHLVGLDMDPEHPAMRALVASQQQARETRARQIGARLDRAAGMALSYDKAAALAGTPAPGRPWFARMLVTEGKVRDEAHAFNRFLKQGQAAFVRTPWASLTEAVTVVREAGGVAAIAHPVRYGLTRRKLRQLLAEFCDAGGQALEVALPRMSPPQQQLMVECLRDFPLHASGGSDFHTPAQLWLELGRVPPFPPGVQPVWELFRTPLPAAAAVPPVTAAP